MPDFVLPILILIILVLFVIVFFLLKKIKSIKENLQEIIFQKSSQSVKYGKLTEQFIPFTEDFPFNSANFRFIGTPIDGIVFDEDQIFFCEFKTASSQLSSKQKIIKDLVKEKKVKWFEFKMR